MRFPRATRPWPRCLRYVVIRAVHQKPSLPRFANGRSDRTPRCTMRSSSRARVVIEVRCHSQPFPVRSAPGCCRESGHGRPGPRSVGQPPATNAVFGRSRHRLGRGTRRPGEDEDRGKPKQGHRPRRRGRRLSATIGEQQGASAAADHGFHPTGPAANLSATNQAARACARSSRPATRSAICRTR